MVDSEWDPSRGGREIWSAVGYRVGDRSRRCRGSEAAFPGVFLSFQSHFRRAWPNPSSVQSTIGRKDPPRLAPLHPGTGPVLDRASARLWRANSCRRRAGLRDDVFKSERKRSGSERSNADKGAHDSGRSARRTHESAFPPRPLRSAASRCSGKEATCMYGESTNAHGSWMRRIVESEHVRGSKYEQTRRWPDEPLDRPSRPPHIHDGDYAAVESPFRHDDSLCNDARSSIRDRNGIA